MIRPDTVHVAAAVFGAAPEIAAADDDSDFNAKLVAFFDCFADIPDYIKVQTGFILSRKSLSADFQQDPFIFWQKG
jgi:hypothetical protein